MKGNDKIAFTAEAVALMRARENLDRFSKYFVSSQTQKRARFISWVVPRNYLDRIFHRRVCLSRDLNKLVRFYKPQQIIELACGYSPRGLVMTQKNPKLVYIETDFSVVIDRKRKILKQIEKVEGVTPSDNYHLVSIDALGGDLLAQLKRIIDRKKRTLVIAETLTSYLNPTEHEFLVGNIKNLLDGVKEGAYLSHESKSTLPGFFGKLLLFYRDRISKTRSYRHFSGPGEIKKYFLNRGSKSVRVVDSEDSNNILYLVTRK